jgi:Phytanoyl-CoA dioxygenase (PhyH)
MQYKVNEKTIEYHPVGEVSIGEPYCLIDQAQDLTAKTSWRDTGYTVETLFEDKLNDLFHWNAVELLFECWQRAGLVMPQNLKPEQYHRLVTAQSDHLRMIEETKLLTADRFPVSIHLLEARISAACGESLIALNPYDGQEIFHFRIIRPGHGDNNPLHRDVWLHDYADCINLYIPVAGSNARSSLVLIPSSHRWEESRIEKTVGGAFINNQKFNVPAVTRIMGNYELIRPDPKPNEVLIFSPYLVHGGAVNLNDDLTRISIEIRLWKK